MSIEAMFFPDTLFEELRPDRQIELWDDELPVMRESLRAKVDEFVDGLFDFDNPEELWSALRKTDSRIVALYFDRLNAATFALKESLKGKDLVQIPDSWPTTVALLLSQRLIQ